MLRHHVDVYDSLKRKFPDAEVIFGTSDKVAEGSPFNFKEKQAIAMAHGINPNSVVHAQSPYVHTFYKGNYNLDDYYVFFAVGEKDITERFAMNNIDPDTGLDMKKPNKETGEIDSKYFQMINTYNGNDPKPMSERGYLFQVDNIEIEGEVASASAFRDALKNAPDKEAAKEVFKQQFSDYKENIFDLVYNKIVGEKMSEELNILRQLSGLDVREVEEGAPVEFESAVNVHDIEFTPPSKSSSFHSIANRFPEGTDVNDPEVKKEEFIQALLRSPASLLSEINERISPSDDNGLEASEKVNKIIKQVEREKGGVAKLNDDDKKFTLELVKKAIKEMELNAGDDTPAYDDEPKAPAESVDLSDIKSDYDIEEDSMEEGRMSDIHQAANEMGKEEFAKEHPEFADDWESMQNDPDAEDEPRDDGTPAYKKYIGKHNESITTLTGKEITIEELANEFANYLQEEKRDTHCSAKCCGADVKAEDCGCSPDCEHCNCNAKLDEAEGYPTKIAKAAGASAGAVAGNSVAGPIGAVAGSFVGMEGGEAFAIAVDKFLAKNKLNAPGIKKRLVDYMQRMMQDTKDTGVAALNNLKQKVYNKDESVNESEPSEKVIDMSDEELMDYVGQKEEDMIDDIQAHIAPDFLHKDNYEEMFTKYREEVLEPAAEEVSADKNADDMAGTDYDSDDFVDNHNMVGDDEINQEESIEDTSNKALEAAMEELKKLSGIEEGSCPKCGNKKHKLMACSSCGCS